MKSVISIILIFGILINSIGNIIIFSIYQSSVRNEIRNYINTDERKKRIEILKFSKADLKKRLITFIKNDEFIFNNQLYDIKNSKAVGDSIFYYCINDTKEKELINKFSNDYEKNTENKSKSNFAKIITPKLLEYFVINYNSALFIKDLFVFIDNYINLYHSLIYQPITPPPKCV
jgi:hypothetical protein